MTLGITLVITKLYVTWGLIIFFIGFVGGIIALFLPWGRN
jgi:hypothetical protein